jgi:hypothetical protein
VAISALSDIPSLWSAWDMSASPVLTDGTEISNWTDTTARSNAVGAAGSRPTYLGNASPSGNPAANFNGTTQTTNASAANTLRNLAGSSIGAVVKVNSTTATQRRALNIFTGGGNTRAMVGQNGTSWEAAGRRLDADAQITKTGGTVDTTNWHLLLLVFDWANGTGQFYVDNAAVGTASHSPGPATRQIPIRLRL